MTTLLSRFACFPLVVLCWCVAFSAAAAETKYYCPMKCEGAKTYAAPGTCPVCAMALERKSEGAGSTALNSTDFRVDLKVSPPSPPAAGRVEQFTFSLRRTKDSSLVQAVETVDEKPMHLVVVSQDLSWFSHEHPEQKADGTYALALMFPHGGNYLLFVDVTPKGDRKQVFPLALQVEGKAAEPVPLKVTKGKKSKWGAYEASLGFDRRLEAGQPITMSYRLQKNGKDVKDLDPYLGAYGHTVGISEDTTEYLHSHPAPAPAPAPGKNSTIGKGTQGGPQVVFTTYFPKAGHYKLWTQFQHAGTVLTFPFVVDVAAPKGSR